jgi:hypothetical protein
MRQLVLVSILGCVLIADGAGASPPPACHEVRVEYQGREYLFSQDGLDFYRWHYTIVADACISRALSYWTIDICSDWLPYITDVSTYSTDPSDLENGVTTYYGYEIGTDPKTGIVGLKWEQIGGNELDSPGEYDAFSFICPGPEEISTTVVWVSKGGQLYDGGTAVRPGCIVIPTDETTWGRLKSIYRRQ